MTIGLHGQSRGVNVVGFVVCLLIELHGYSVLGEKGSTGYLGTVALPWALLGSKKTVANGVQLTAGSASKDLCIAHIS